MICELGQNRGVGFDPGFRPERLEPSAAQRIKFIQDFYGEKYAHEKADFVCSKMTLEHITDAGNFIGGVRRAIGDNESFVFFQIPESTRILRDCAFEDVYYEHCSYYSPGSLARLFRRNGFEVLDLKTEYDEQYLTIEAKGTAGKANGSKALLQAENDLDTLRKLVADFRVRVKQKLAHWRNVLDDAKKNKKTVALWGSGSKGVSFLTSLGVTTEVAFVVDLNPHRWNHYMSGTGHPIVGPSQLKELAPDIVIVMNPIYRGEIVADLSSNGLNPTVLTL
jgi:hypothetical protein